MQVEIDYWVDLLRLALACGGGRLHRTGILAQAVRGAVLIDLVAHGALTRDDTGLHYATDPARG